MRFAGRDLAGASPRDTVKAGLVHVIEGHRVFTQLSVLDNLLLAGYDLPRGERAARVEEALAFFPEIAAKRHERAAALSGGQQQMLAVAQGLVRRPRLLMLDEPSAGLSPVLVDRVLAVVRRLREAGTAVLLVEQLIEKALALADRVYALARGSIVLEARTGEADLPHRLEHAYLATAVVTRERGQKAAAVAREEFDADQLQISVRRQHGCGPRQGGAFQRGVRHRACAQSLEGAGRARRRPHRGRAVRHSASAARKSGSNRPARAIALSMRSTALMFW